MSEDDKTAQITQITPHVQVNWELQRVSLDIFEEKNIKKRIHVLRLPNFFA